MKSFNKTGMTLVELMVVVAIIALLMGIMAYYVLGRQQNNAQVDMANDVLGLLQVQRTRAMSMNVSTYVRFVYRANRVSTIIPRIGSSSVCSNAGQLPILYTDGPYSEANMVAIDVSPTLNNHRTLDSTDTNKYIAGNNNSYTDVTVQIVDQAHNNGQNVQFTAAQHDTSFDICFQPNGQAQFLKNAIQPGATSDDPEVDVNRLLLDVIQARIIIDTQDHHSGGTYYVDVTGLGMIQSGSTPRS